MNQRDQWLFCEEETLLKNCRVDTYKSSGPGGQRKNKVATAIRLVHKPSGISAQGQETRSQARNKILALRNLRMHIACACRTKQDIEHLLIPDQLAEYFKLSKQQGPKAQAKMRLAIAGGSWCFWPTAALVLDVFDAAEGQLASAARAMNISTGNLASFLRSHRNLLASAQAIRQAHGHSPLH